MTGSALLFPKTELFHTCAVCVPRLSTKRGLPQKFDSATGLADLPFQRSRVNFPRGAFEVEKSSTSVRRGASRSARPKGYHPPGWRAQPVGALSDGVPAKGRRPGKKTPPPRQGSTHQREGIQRGRTSPPLVFFPPFLRKKWGPCRAGAAPLLQSPGRSSIIYYMFCPDRERI